MENTNPREMTQIVVRLPIGLRRRIEQYLREGKHKDISEFVRDALRQKLEHDVVVYGPSKRVEVEGA